MSYLLHETVFKNSDQVVLDLPFLPSLQQYHINGSFPLTKDPNVEESASIIGMFVIRPDNEPYIGNLVELDGSNPDSFYDNYNWSYNCAGLEGGWLISNRNPVDIYRLAIQYGLVDAVIIGSNTVSLEGVPNESKEGYIWQPYGPCQWKQLKDVDSELELKIALQRKEWQRLGYLSDRKYPAEIVFTWSGDKYQTSDDFLQGKIFNSTHPDGSEIEVYIITGQDGAAKIRSRAALYNLEHRINDMIIELPSIIENDKNSLDLSIIPSLLYKKFGMKIVNHDGGQIVLDAFIKAGIICQLNLTLGRLLSLKEVVNTIDGIDDDKREEVLSDFNSRMSYFFNYRNEKNNIIHSIPRILNPVEVIIATPELEVAIVVLNCNGKGYFLNQN
eukprot:gene7836-10643_t